MCGIVGFVGKQECSGILLEGLRRLEYRGYDSAGLAVYDGQRTNLLRVEGKLAGLEKVLREKPLPGSIGIGHTRWATHGRPSEENAHPHKAGPVVVVHNGIIENHMHLKRELLEAGVVFHSETDTEIISHLVFREIAAGADLEAAVRAALKRIEGSYAIAVSSETEPDKIVAARFASPLVIGLGEGENFVASDIPAILAHTRNVLFLEDGEMAVISGDSVRISTIDGKTVSREPRRIEWSATMAERGGYKHFMLKEIHEQPRAITDTLRGRISLERGEVILDGATPDREMLAALKRIVIVACGTSWHAALVGRQWVEDFCRLPVDVELGSEFRYRDPVLGPDVLVIAISQSGETADTLAAVKDARRRGVKVLSICNVIESSIPRASDFVVYTHAGPEIGVASTKAFVTQLAALYLIAVDFARRLGHMDARAASHKLLELVRVPLLVEEILQSAAEIEKLAGELRDARGFLFIGRWINYPIALEGALKLKEISYIHAEGYPAGEMKHGPIALIEENLPVVAIAPHDRVYEKIVSNMQEARARRARIVALASRNDAEISSAADHVFRIPEIDEHLEPLLTVVPLQLLAYYIADGKGTDVDQPRNLAKSVTVE